jgi:hypothetical protein
MKISIYIIIIILLLVSCNDRKIPKENELKQYPWIGIFTPGCKDFEGIEHNLDLGTYSFSFKTRYLPIDTFFKMTDNSAVNDKWEIIQKSVSSRKYEKKSTVYVAAKGFDIVTLTFNPDDSRITFTFSINK